MPVNEEKKEKKYPLRVIELFREKKKEWGFGEGVIEKLTPLPSNIENLDVIENLNLPDIQRRLVIQHGTASGSGKRQWYKVIFPRPIRNPAVVAVAEVRTGEIIRKDIEKISDIVTKTIENIPNISFSGIPSIEDIPRIARDDFNSDYYCDRVASRARDGLKNLGGIPWPLSSIWGWFCDHAVYWIAFYTWKAGGWVVNVLWDSFFQRQIDNIRNTINSNNAIISSRVNSAFNDASRKINNLKNKLVNSINETIGDTNAKINSQLSKIQDRVNNRIKDLYDMWGIPYDTAITPVHIRNVTSAGFEWLSLGDMKIYWVAVGRKLV